MLTVGTEAPDFTLPDQNGEMHSLSDYRGLEQKHRISPCRTRTERCTASRITGDRR